MLKIHFLFPLKISERVLPMVNAGNVTVLHSSVHRGTCLARRVTEPKWDSDTINLLKGHSIELTTDDFLLHQRSVHLTTFIREASIVSSWWLRLPQPVNMQRREYSMLNPKWAIYIIQVQRSWREMGLEKVQRPGSGWLQRKCFLDMQPHTWPHRGRDSNHKTCESPHQTKSHHGEELLAVSVRGRICSMGVQSPVSLPCSGGRLSTQEFMSSSKWV